MNKIKNKYGFYFLHSLKKEIGKSIIYGIILSFIITYMINASGLFSLGISGIAQGLSYTFMEAFGNNNLDSEKFIQLISFWSLYTLMSIPIIIFTYYKHEKTFFVLTIVMIVVTILSGFIIPNIPGLTNVSFILDSFGLEGESSRELGRLALATIGGILYGIIAGFTFKQGGSSGGTDPIARYLSKTKGIEIGNFNLILSAIIILTFLILNDFIISPPTGGKTIDNFFIVLFGPKTIGTILFAVGTNLMINNIFPSKRIVIVKIDTNKGEIISNLLNNISWKRNHSIYDIKSGKNKKTRQVITMVINLNEVEELKKILNEIDPKAFITFQFGYDVIGNYSKKEII